MAASLRMRRSQFKHPTNGSANGSAAVRSGYAAFVPHT
jgi:hypothetical protein